MYKQTARAEWKKLSSGKKDNGGESKKASNRKLFFNWSLQKAERVTTRMWDKATHTDGRLCTEIRWQSDEVRFPPPIGEEAELRLWVTYQTIMTLAAAGGKHWFCREEHSNTVTFVFWNGSLESGRGVVQAGVMTKGDSRWNEISAGGTRVEWLLRYIQGCHSTAHLGRWWEREHVPIIITSENIMGQVFWGIYPPFCFIIGRRQEARWKIQVGLSSPWVLTVRTLSM